MKIINPQKVKKADLVIGIPSYNEADNIVFVVEKAQEGLKKYFPRKKSVIINVDNHSSDGTKEAFFGLNRSGFLIPRIYISTPKNIKGKGYNFYNLFRFMKKIGARAGVVVDADLKSITPLWVKRLASPVLEKKYDFVLPYYARLKCDATITNHLIYPLVFGVLGFDARQAIGGDFAFSRKMLDVWLDKKWPRPAKEFGIDIFMSLNAFFSRAKICQVNLGKKIHKPSSPKLGPMFLQVAETLFRLLALNRKSLERKTAQIPLLGGKKLDRVPNANSDFREPKKLFLKEFLKYKKQFPKFLDPEICQRLNKMRKEKMVEINDELWLEILYSYFFAFKKRPFKKGFLSLRCLFFGRVATFFKEIEGIDVLAAEEAVRKQARLFREAFLEKSQKGL